jgi:hypothetical protein
MKIAKVNNEDENNIKNRLPWDNESVFKWNFTLVSKEKIEAVGIDVLMKDIQSARLAGFGSSGSAVELFVQKQNLKKYIL